MPDDFPIRAALAGGNLCLMPRQRECRQNADDFPIRAALAGGSLRLMPRRRECRQNA